MELFTLEWKCFLEVARRGNISKAADKLQLPQPSVTKYLRKLESKLGLVLFERSNRGAWLTQTGKEIYSEIERKEGEIQVRLQHALQRRDALVGTVSFGCHRVLAMNYVSNQMAELYRQFPELSLEMHLATSLEISRLVATGKLDYGLVANPVPLPGLVIRKALEEEVAIYSKQESRHENCDRILFNPEMQFLPRILKKLQHQKMEGVPDYDLIGDLASRHEKLGALVPFGVARRYGLNKRASPRFYSATIALIFRSGLERTERHAKIIERFAPRRTS